MLKLIRADLKMLLRNRQALAWALLFPLLFTMIFGLFFGRDNTSFGNISLVNNSKSEVAQGLVKGLEESELFKVEASDSLETIKNEIADGKSQAALYLPEGFGDPVPNASKQATIFYDPGSTQIVSVLSNYVEKYLTGASFSLQGAKPLFSIQQEQVSSGKNLTYFDFVLAGVLGLALMNGSVIGVAVAMGKYREDQILKRITTTPLPTWKFILAEVLSRMVLNVFQIAIILLVGVELFGANISGNYFVLLAVALFGGILFQLIGFVIASLTKTVDAAQGMTQAITLPMMFLAGVFFPIDSLPKWLAPIVQYLPLAPLLRIIREVSLEDLSPFHNLTNVGIVLAWVVAALVIAIWRFRLSEE